jgi:hypothetical protein
MGVFMGQGISTKELVRLRAYAIWIAEGQPEGRERQHWERARKEIRREITTPDRDIDGHLAPGHVSRPAREG